MADHHHSYLALGCRDTLSLRMRVSVGLQLQKKSQLVVNMLRYAVVQLLKIWELDGHLLSVLNEPVNILQWCWFAVDLPDKKPPFVWSNLETRHYSCVQSCQVLPKRMRVLISTLISGTKQRLKNSRCYTAHKATETVAQPVVFDVRHFSNSYAH